ncbi:carbohydrate esterase family 3 protein [Xylariaceae sp. FL0804]|nr:carbohydrate esterase family 3 protein [Xylariaceae sp. FL0804]
MVALKFLPAAMAAVASARGALAQNTTLRYMPFGDSITQITCWRSLLWQRLQNTTAYSNGEVNFVGSNQEDSGACAITDYDKDNEGHSGYLAIDIADSDELVGWLQQNPADVITMHLGTNDIVQQNKATADILAAFTTLVGQMRDSNPNMKIIVAQIIPLGIGDWGAQVQALNAAIPGWAQGLNQTASPIWVVDQYTGFDAANDLRDGVHPNAAGDQKMADVWYPALVNALEVAQQGMSSTRRARAVVF